MPKLKMKLPQTHTALLASTDVTWLPQVPKPLQEWSQHHSLPFWARADPMCTDPSKQANFWHTSNYRWAHKLGIPPFTFLKWPEQVGALRDVGVYVVQRQPGSTRAVLPSVLLCRYFTAETLYSGQKRTKLSSLPLPERTWSKFFWYSYYPFWLHLTWF